MFPHRFNASHSRPDSDRNPRLWNGHGDSRDRRDPPGEKERPTHYNYSAVGERIGRRRDYSTSPKRPYRKESFDVDRSRRSPSRRRMSSPGWDSSDRKRQSFEGEGSYYNRVVTDDTEEGDYRFRHVSDVKTRQWPSDRLDVCATKDLEHSEFQGGKSLHFGRSPDYRHSHLREEVTYRHHRNSDSQLLPGGHEDRDGHKSGYFLPERKPSEGQSSKYYESDVAQNQAAVAQQSTSTKGFQRFLDLLNKGVDVDMLNKIVGQSPSNHRAHLPHSTPNIDGQRDIKEQHLNDSPPQWQVSEQSERRSLSPVTNSHPTASRSRSRSPKRADKVTLTPEEEHKHKQMQNVLQAIGLNLGFEELGQMSHRIQERLYGKRESDGQGIEGKSKEKDLRQGRVPSPRSQSRSSSSSSSESTSAPEHHVDSYLLSDHVAGPGDELQKNQQATTYSYQAAGLGDQHLGNQQGSTYSHQESRPRGEHQGNQQATTYSYQAAGPGNEHQGNQQVATYSYQGSGPGGEHHRNQQAATYSYQGHFPPPVLSTYPPANYHLPYPPRPPTLHHVPPVPAVFLPPRPPFLSPPLPPFTTFPPQIAHTSYCPPQNHAGPQPWINPLVQPFNNNQKPKTLSRPRCLQVIETKQAG